jgi:DNA ligase D-like protein (predicted ligase)
VEDVTAGLTDAWEPLSRAERELLRPAALPSTLPAAMLATLTEDRFSHPDWVFERKLDGVRCLARRTAAGEVRLLSRNDKDMSRTYPEIVEAVADQADRELIVDGEVVAFDGRRTSFERLQGRLGLTDADAARSTGIPVFYYVFDLLHLAGQDVTALPLRTRKALLRHVVGWHGPLRLTPHRNRDGEAFYEEACRKGWEGLIAKRAEAPYVHGRSREWLKFKCSAEQELVIGGFTAPRGSRTDLGALLLGVYDDGKLRYAGKVGTGFTRATLRDLAERLAPLVRDASPFVDRVREPHSTWVEPRLVAQVGFSEWTRDGRLRHPRFLGLRDDKAAEEVVRESVS